MIWAALAGLGAASLVLSFGTAVLLLLWSAGTLTFPSAPGFTVAYVPALSLGFVVARALGGWIATLGVVAFAAAAATRLLVYIDAETLFSYSAIPAGLLLGGVISAIVGRPHIPFRRPLEAAGVIGLVGLAGSLIDTAARQSPPSDPHMYGFALSLVGTVGAGALLASRSPRPMHDAVSLARVLVVIALVMLPILWMGGASDPRNVAASAWRFAQPLVLVGAAWLATWIGVTGTRSGHPGIYTRRALLGVILFVAALSWLPAYVGPALLETPFDNRGFWVGLSSNLFSSVVFAAITIFGLDVLLEGIAQRSPKNAAMRRLAVLHAEWIFNRLYTVAPPPFRDHIPDLSNAEVEVAAAIANAWPTRGDDVRASLRRLPVRTNVLLADELVDRLDAIRNTAAIASAALQPPALEALLSATTHLEVIRDRLPAARAQIDQPDDMARVHAMVTGELIADCIGFLALVHRLSR